MAEKRLASKGEGFSTLTRRGKKGIHLLVAEKRLTSKGEGFSTLTRRGKKGINMLVAAKRAVLTCGGQQKRGFTY